MVSLQPVEGPGGFRPVENAGKQPTRNVTIVTHSILIGGYAIRIERAPNLVKRTGLDAATAELNLHGIRGTYIPMDDSSAAETLRAGTPEAFERLVEAYGDRLFRSAVLLSGNEQAAEDIVQETFLRAFRASATFRGHSAVFTWLYGILLNVNRKRCRTASRLTFLHVIPDVVAGSSDDPGLSTDNDHVVALIAAALTRLSVKHREVIVLHYYEDMSLEEMAGHIRVSCGTVKSRLHYAREHLRRLLPQNLNLFT
jgi:RNA polymerase sigma-70 factor (ECF subfamily)